MESLLIFILWLVIYAVIIYLCVLAIIWVFNFMGYPLPPKVQNALYLIGLLLLLIYIIQTFPLGALNFPGPTYRR